MFGHYANRGLLSWANVSTLYNMVYTNQVNHRKIREFHVASKMSGKIREVSALRKIREFHVHTFATI